jgi:hypothetical protein
LFVAVPAQTAAAQTPPRRGVPPQDAWTWPLTHPIKGNFTTYSGERCYATETDAVTDGFRRSNSASSAIYLLVGLLLLLGPARFMRPVHA